MSSQTPPRFKPELVEQSVKSPKRFKVEPEETITRSTRRFTPEPIVTTTKSTREDKMTVTQAPRRFAPEPVETISKSSRDSTNTGTRPLRRFSPEPVETKSSGRRFALQPVETSVKSSRDKFEQGQGGSSRRRFLPQPIETSTKSTRKKADASEGLSKSSAASNTAPTPSQSDTNTKPPRRKFAPQLIETSKRTRKAGDKAPAILPSDKTEATPGEHVPNPKKVRPPPIPAPPGNTPNHSVGHVPRLLEPRGQVSAFSSEALRRNSRSSNRSHSFRVPELDPIESSESGESDASSPSTSPSSSSGQPYLYKHATRIRESVDDRVSGYLLELAAKAAEKQLREQALAAFPNDDIHEPVDHFIDHDSEETTIEHSWNDGGGEFTTVNWELREMQRHQEKREEQRILKENQEKAASVARGRQKSKEGPWGNPYANIGLGGGWEREINMEQMRNNARPPMLGGSIVFPRSDSPEPARFDVTQGSAAIRNSMCYLTEQSQSNAPDGLWCNNTKSTGNRASLWSRSSSRHPSKDKGLWGGFCVETSEKGPAGLLTPRIEMDDLMLTTPPPTPTRQILPPSPPTSNVDMMSIDEKLGFEQTIEEEFSDDFVTQVYNYLALGYAAVARDFDEELSKISRIPIQELRHDDELAQSRGYIRLGEDEDMKDVGVVEERCMRWRALRTYIHEWARQQPRMDHGREALGQAGVTARKGSWAF